MKTPNELHDGYVIASHGHEHRFYHVHVRDNGTENEYDYYEILRTDDNAWMGRVSRYTRMDRVNALIERRYEPEETRITEPFTFGSTLRVGRKNPRNGYPDVWYITIPEIYVQRFRIRVDDEILVHIGDTEPNTAIDELYHVSMQSKTTVIVLSKIKRKAGEDNPAPEYNFTPGEFRTVRIEASPSEGRRWDLFYFYDRIRKAMVKNPDRYTVTSSSWDIEKNEPLPQDEPITVFNDF